jgi:photosystem II stability/assembly factor-like uncharacterized protein
LLRQQAFLLPLAAFVLFCAYPMKRASVIFILLFSLCSCRKDLLHWQAVQKLETHTTTDRLNKILFINDSLGFVVGGQRFYNSTILTTKDGGQTWEYKNFSDAGKGLYGIAKSPSGMIYTIGFDGKLLRSTDGGDNWEFHQLWYLPYKDIAFFDNTRGIGIGGVSFKFGCKTSIFFDGNYSVWDSLGYELNDIEMIDGKTGYLSGHGVVMKTNDSGHTWQMQNIKNDNFTAIHAYGQNEAWTCGYNGSIFHTTDGGNSWQKMRNGNDLKLPSYHLLDILFTDRMHGFAIGENGLFIFTDDGGHHWMEFDRFTNATLRCIVKMKDGQLLVCGDNGSLYKVSPKLLQ